MLICFIAQPLRRERDRQERPFRNHRDRNNRKASKPVLCPLPLPEHNEDLANGTDREQERTGPTPQLIKVFHELCCTRKTERDSTPAALYLLKNLFRRERDQRRLACLNLLDSRRIIPCSARRLLGRLRGLLSRCRR